MAGRQTPVDSDDQPLTLAGGIQRILHEIAENLLQGFPVGKYQGHWARPHDQLRDRHSRRRNNGAIPVGRPFPGAVPGQNVRDHGLQVHLFGFQFSRPPEQAEFPRDTPQQGDLAQHALHGFGDDAIQLGMLVLPGLPQQLYRKLDGRQRVLDLVGHLARQLRVDSHFLVVQKFRDVLEDQHGVGPPVGQFQRSHGAAQGSVALFTDQFPTHTILARGQAAESRQQPGDALPVSLRGLATVQYLPAGRIEGHDFPALIKNGHADGDPLQDRGQELLPGRKVVAGSQQIIPHEGKRAGQTADFIGSRIGQRRTVITLCQ